LEVVGLDYPGHVAAAVRFDETEPGDFVQYKGAKFTITDPTYMEASIGMCMPEYKNMNPLHIIATTK
jgi:hypothetical protein